MSVISVNQSEALATLANVFLGSSANASANVNSSVVACTSRFRSRKERRFLQVKVFVRFRQSAGTTYIIDKGMQR
jgi:hypothetical protein